MSNENEDYGHATIGVGTTNEKVKIENWISAYYVDGRKVTVTRLEGDKIAMVIENHETSNRSPRQEMLLTQDSFVALYSTMSLHMMGEGLDVEKTLSESMNRYEIDYSCSPNLKM